MNFNPKLKPYLKMVLNKNSLPERYALKASDGILNPDAIAEAYWQLHCQQRSAWTHELDLRPWSETF